MMLSFLRWCLSFLIPTKTIHASPRPLHPFDPVSDDSQPLSPFDSLPHEIVGTIFGKLTTGDRARTMLVCKSWRDRLMLADFAVEREPPWLILSNDSYDEPQPFLNEVSFESVFEHRKYTFTLPKSECTTGRWRWWCFGSPGKGWLLMSGRLGPDLTTTVMMLWDPLSGATVKLPPLSTLPFFNRMMEDCLRAGLQNLSFYTFRAQLLSVGGHPVAVAVLFVDSRNLEGYHVALCSPQDGRWSSVRGGGGETFKDILFRGGKLYVLYNRQDIEVDPMSMWSLSSVIEKERYAIGLGCGELEVIKLEIVYEDLNHGGEQDVDEPVGFSTCKRWHQIEHLLVDPDDHDEDHELLVVSLILDFNSFVNGNAPGPIPNFSCSQTGGIEVRRLIIEDSSENGGEVVCKLEKMDRIGERCIFVGTSGSTTVDGVDGECIRFATSDVPGCFTLGDVYEIDYDAEEGHYIDDDLLVDEEMQEEHGGHDVNYDGLHDHDVNEDQDESYYVREQGVFYVPEGKVNRILATTASHQSGFCTGWFTPN